MIFSEKPGCIADRVKGGLFGAAQVTRKTLIVAVSAMHARAINGKCERNY
jgi:hypothetical protein